MSAQRSPFSGKRYSLALAMVTWHVPRAAVYRHRARCHATMAPAQARRGHKAALTAAALLEAIRGVLAASPSWAKGIARCGLACTLSPRAPQWPAACGCCAMRGSWLQAGPTGCWGRATMTAPSAPGGPGVR